MHPLCNIGWHLYYDVFQINKTILWKQWVIDGQRLVRLGHWNGKHICLPSHLNGSLFQFLNNSDSSIWVQLIGTGKRLSALLLDFQRFNCFKVKRGILESLSGCWSKRDGMMKHQLLHRLSCCQKLLLLLQCSWELLTDCWRSACPQNSWLICTCNALSLLCLSIALESTDNCFVKALEWALHELPVITSSWMLTGCHGGDGNSL